MECDAQKITKSRLKTFVLFDTETTGLPSCGYNPHIIELCFIAVTREELLTKQSTSRVLNKLVMCFNPFKKIDLSASKITGLYNDALEDMLSFKKQAPLIFMFLKNLPQPVCLIAHNGNRFDFPLLVSQLRSMEEIPKSIFCADSLEALRVFDGLPYVSDFLLQREKVITLSAASLTAGTQEVKSLSNTTVTSGHVSKQHTAQDIEHYEDTNKIEASQSCYDNFKLKRTAETPNYFCRNSKEAKVSSIQVKWDKTEHTPDMFKKTTSVKAESVTKYRESLQDKICKVRQYLFHDDFVAQSSFQDSDLHPPPETILPSCKESITSNHTTFVESVNSTVLLLEGANAGNKSLGKGTHETRTDIVKISNSTHEDKTDINISPNDFLEGAKGRILELESAFNIGNEKAANGQIFTQACKNGMGNISASQLTPGGLKGCVGTFKSRLRAEKLSYSLSSVYARMFGKESLASHTAEGDCLALLEIVRAKVEEFSSWCDQFAVPLSNIRPMY